MNLDSPNMDRFVREKEAAVLLSVSPSTLRRLEQRAELPHRRAISPNTRGWLLSEIMEFVTNRRAVAAKETARPAK